MPSWDFKPGQQVIFTSVPTGWLDDLPEEDQGAIKAVIGKPVQFHGFDDDGGAEMEFTGPSGISHTIWLDQALVRAAE